jgi:hypothetical protein
MRKIVKAESYVVNIVLVFDIAFGAISSKIGPQMSPSGHRCVTSQTGSVAV